MQDLTQNIQYIKGVGPNRATLLNKLGIFTLEDLITNGYYVADDSEGNVVDPRNSKHNLNGLKIKLTYDKGKVQAQVIEEE